MNRPKIVIADDHNLVAELCRTLLEKEYEIVSTVSDGDALIRATLQFKPQVIVVDIGMPLVNGLDAGQRIKHMVPSVKIIFLTMNGGTDLAAEAFRRGASGFLLKTCATDELLVAVRNVLKGRSYLSSAMTKDAVDFLLRQGRPLVEDAERLTDRQREVLELLAEGKSMKEVATTLKVTARTVAFHKYRIMEVLGVKSSAALVQYAMRNHLIAA
jgi:DNA-binding NarL/FixJ family response regulator